MRRRSDSGREDADPVPVLAPSLRAAAGTALYVHLPYCVTKCTYCDFFSVGVGERRIEGNELDSTVEALLREARRRAPDAPRTVFFGGGTPSYLDEAQLERLLDGLDACTGFRASATEVTLECNPESLTLEKATALRRLGVHRLSIGFQSLEPRILELFGRVHSSAMSFAAYEAARRAGFERLSIDVIYGVPGQELDTWERDLGRVLALEPEHVSAYSLAFEEGTAMTADLERGRIERLSEDLELAFFLRTRELFLERGYEAYEVSNFALNGARCTHNENYWRNGAYVGLGPGAVSQLMGTRFGNPRSIDRWRRAIQSPAAFAATWEETLSPLARLGETWWLGLRTLDGVDPAAARASAGIPDDADDPAEREAARLESQGLVARRGSAWRLTDRGLPLADAVSARFLEACPNDASATRAQFERATGGKILGPRPGA